MRIPFQILTAAELKPGMRLFHPKLVAGWRVTAAHPTSVFSDEGGEIPRMALKFEDDRSFTAYPPERQFRVIGKRAKIGHEHDFVMTFAQNAVTRAYDVPVGRSCSQCGEPE